MGSQDGGTSGFQTGERQLYELSVMWSVQIPDVEQR